MFLVYLLALCSFLGLTISQDDTCSATSPCASGCCGGSSTPLFCGLGPTFCGAGNCTGTCDQKSQCDPGWGSEWSSAEKCPLNVCCSQFGFCGTTSDFCGADVTVPSPSCSGTSSSARVMGYYEGWSIARSCDQMYPEQIPVGAYTHLNYGFAYIDPDSFAVSPMSSTDQELWPRFTALKNFNPGLETWISIGGWSMNDADQPTAATFSDLAGSEANQNLFFNSLINFLTTWGFQGVDIDALVTIDLIDPREYPVAPERSGKEADFANYVTFLQNLKNALGSSGNNFGLTITLPSSYWYMQNFDIVSISKIVDWFNLMTYDLHGTWDSTDPSIGAIENAHTNLTEIDQTLDLLWRNDIDPSLVTLGLGFYGRSFTLTDPSCTTAGCPFSSGGNAGPCTATSGILSYAEIEQVIAQGATVTLNQAAAVQEVVWDSNQWVSYDDAETIKLKVDYANSKCLGGLMVWAASLDDHNGTAAAALGESTGRSSSTNSSALSDSLSNCIWSECGGKCPAGQMPVQSTTTQVGPGNSGTDTSCPNNELRTFCCASTDVPSCMWRGVGPFCIAPCESGEIQMATDTGDSSVKCLLGHRNLCCTQDATTNSTSALQWSGNAPSCEGSCGSSSTLLTTDPIGLGGDQPCISGSKALCSSDKLAVTTNLVAQCYWTARVFGYFGGATCTMQCRKGYAPEAIDPTGCKSGTARWYCCEYIPPVTLPSSLTPANQQWQTVMRNFATYNTPGCVDFYVTSKRGLGPDISVRQPSDPTLSQSQIDSLAQALAFAFLAYRSLNGPTESQAQFVELYQENLQEVFNASPDDFVQYYGIYPNADPAWLTKQLICDGSAVGDDLSAAQSNQELCILPTAVTPAGCRGPAAHEQYKRSNVSLNISELLKRTLTANQQANGESGPGVPVAIGRLMNAVRTGQFTFQYTNLQNIRNINGDDNMDGPINQEQGILEIAWLMGPGNDVTNVDATNQEFFEESDPPDLFFVVHLHVDHVLYDQTGNPYLGIYAMVGFHGQYVNTDNRVDGRSRSGRNTRTPLFQCPGYTGVMTANEYVYPGFNTDGSDELNLFLQYLYTQGLATEAQVTPIIDGDPETTINNCDFFEWTNLPTGSSGSRGADGRPYQPPAGL